MLRDIAIREAVLNGDALRRGRADILGSLSAVGGVTIFGFR